MFGEKNRAIEITTLIGKTCKLTGNIITKESIRVDGQITGNIQSEGIVSLTDSAVFEGDIKATEIFIAGKVKGNITAYKHLELEKTAVIIGDIATAKLLIHSGASFNGNTKMGEHLRNVTVEEKKPTN